MDLVVVTKTFPKKGETITGQSFFTNPGGKGANQAVTIAKMGSEVEMVGAVGHDFGIDLINALRKYNVSTKHVKHLDGVSSGTATIIVSQDDNRIILNPAANYSLKVEDIAMALEDAHEGDYLLCQLEVPLEIVDFALKVAKTKKMVTFLNPAPSVDLPQSMFECCDFFIPNQTESEHYTGIYPHNMDESKIAATKLLEKGVKNVLITLGEKGAYFFNGRDEHFRAAHEVEALDTTGAGDTYIGTFLTILSENQNVVDAMDYASRAASITIQRMGAQQAIPYRHEIDEYYEGK